MNEKALNAIIFRNWAAALEKENPARSIPTYWVGVNPGCKDVWRPKNGVLFTADANVAFRLMSKPRVKAQWTKMISVVDDAIIKMMEK